MCNLLWSMLLSLFLTIGISHLLHSFVLHVSHLHWFAESFFLSFEIMIVIMQYVNFAPLGYIRMHNPCRYYRARFQAPLENYMVSERLDHDVRFYVMFIGGLPLSLSLSFSFFSLRIWNILIELQFGTITICASRQNLYRNVYEKFIVRRAVVTCCRSIHRRIVRSFFGT